MTEVLFAAHARTTDPETSHIAAQHHSPASLSETQRRVVALLRVNGPMTDERLHSEYRHVYGPISASGCRTRRKEAVDAGLVEQSDVEGRTGSGGRCVTWRARAAVESGKAL